MVSIDYARARRALMRRDPVIATLIRLLHAIIAQQLSTKAAKTIEGRFSALFDGGATPAAVVRVPDEKLRAVGLSGQKLKYIRDLCARILDGSLKLETLTLLPDDEVIAALTCVKGIGRWTAEMFLMFRLHRPDVLPVGDLGIVKAVQRAYKLRALPTPARLTKIGETWRPYRSVACWYLWASLDAPPVKTSKNGRG